MKIEKIKIESLKPYANNAKIHTMELDPGYADVIIDRWEQETGGKAVQIDGNK